jgi:hypothetical protein
MKTIKVAWGFTNSINAKENDPNAELNLKQHTGEPMYTTYTLKNKDVLDGFKLCLEEMDCYLSGYLVEKNV